MGKGKTFYLILFIVVFMVSCKPKYYTTEPYNTMYKTILKEDRKRQKEAKKLRKLREKKQKQLYPNQKCPFNKC